ALRIDLHIHSSASDGSLSPGAVATAAREAALHVIALADHDTTAGFDAAREAAAGSVHVIPAVELSTYAEPAELHILGYYLDPSDPALLAHARRASGAREVRMRAMIQRLAGLGVAV